MGSIHSSSSGGTTSTVSSMRSADGTLVISMRSADGTLEERFVPPAGSTRVDASRGGQPLGPPSFALNPNAAEFVPGVEYNYDERQRYACGDACADTVWSWSEGALFVRVLHE